MIKGQGFGSCLFVTELKPAVCRDHFVPAQHISRKAVHMTLTDLFSAKETSNVIVMTLSARKVGLAQSLMVQVSTMLEKGFRDTNHRNTQWHASGLKHDVGLEG